MARGDSRLGMWQVLLTASMVLIITPLSAYGRHSLAAGSRRHHHHNSNNNNQSSVVTKEAFGARTALSDDSAERDHLIGAGLPHSSGRHRSHKHAPRLDFEEEDLPVAAAAGGEELTAGGGAGPDQPGNPLSDDDVITVEFHSPAPDTVPSDDNPAQWPKVPVPQRQKAGDPTAWTLSDFYDYLAPDDDLSALDTTPEPEPSPSPPPSMEDENPLLAAGSPVMPDNTKSAGGASLLPGAAAPAPGGPGGADNGGQGLGLGGGGGGALGPDGCRLGFVRPSGAGACVSQCDADPNFCFNGGVCTAVAGAGAFCRCNVQEYIWNKGARCDWMVTEFQVLCALVGVATVVLLLLFMIIVFFSKRLHRLKNENRRLRKRSKYRAQSGEPQTDGMSLSTTADGSQPNVRKLCDTPPQPPPQAHAHNLAYYDNIICQKPTTSSYIWHYKPRNPYNHHQDDPQKQLQEDLVKTPPAKEEESMNIRNSHSPKQENNRPLSVNLDLGLSPGTTPGQTPVDDNTENTENTEDGVTIDLELLLPKDAKLRPEASAPLRYDVFLYKLGSNGDSASPGGQAPPNSYHPPSHPVPKSPKTPKAPKASKSPKAAPKSPKSPKSPKAPKSPKRVQNHSPDHRRQPASARMSSPGRHSVNGCYPSPARHPSPTRRSWSQHRNHPSSSSPSTPPQLRRPRGRTQAPGGSQHSSSAARDPRVVTVNIRPSPSSPHLTPQSPPSSPSRVRFGHVSTRSLPPLC